LCVSFLSCHHPGWVVVRVDGWVCLPDFSGGSDVTYFIFVPGSGTNDIFEVILVIAAGLGFNLWFEERRREKTRREQAMLKLEAVQREVQDHIKTVRENEKRIAVLHSVTTAINQFNNLDSIFEYRRWIG